jgi:hypothetical protein
MKNLIRFCVLLSIVFFSCSNPDTSKKNDGLKSKDSLTSFYRFNANELSKFGIFVSDSKVMYNNKIFNLGTLNIVISGTNYSVGTSTQPVTNYDFYPRYITTLDTVQRYAYNLQGKGSNTVEEAQKWNTFDKLIPVVVEQKQGDNVFGESLVFWFTKTDSLLVKLNSK